MDNRSGAKANKATLSHDHLKVQIDRDLPILDLKDCVLSDHSKALQQCLPSPLACLDVQNLQLEQHLPTKLLCNLLIFSSR